jgi:hypothetical protein
MPSSADPTFDEPMRISVAEGAIVVLGPGDVGVCMTAAAARESARRLMEAANRLEPQYPSPLSEAPQIYDKGLG